MFSIFYFIIKYIDKITLLFLFLIVPFFTFFILFFLFKTQIEDVHVVMILVMNTLLYIDINILGLVMIRKLNKIIKQLKQN